MGYANTDILIYGVSINEEVAEHFYEHFFNHENECILHVAKEHKFYRNNNENIHKINMTGISPSNFSVQIFYPLLFSDKTDSRVHNLIYEPNKEHFAGIYVGSQGYGWQDNIKLLNRKKPIEVINNYNLYLKQLLSDYGCEDTPDWLYISQVW